MPFALGGRLRWEPLISIRDSLGACPAEERPFSDRYTITQSRGECKGVFMVFPVFFPNHAEWWFSTFLVGKTRNLSFLIHPYLFLLPRSSAQAARALTFFYSKESKQRANQRGAIACPPLDSPRSENERCVRTAYVYKVPCFSEYRGAPLSQLRTSVYCLLNSVAVSPV